MKKIRNKAPIKKYERKKHRFKVMRHTLLGRIRRLSQTGACLFGAKIESKKARAEVAQQTRPDNSLKKQRDKDKDGTKTRQKKQITEARTRQTQQPRRTYRQKNKLKLKRKHENRNKNIDNRQRQRQTQT